VAAETLAIIQVCTSNAGRALPVYISIMAAWAAVSLVAARSLSGSRPAAVVLCAAVLRATLLFGSPDLSDDLVRYVWAGRVAASGLSPYALARSAPALDAVARRGAATRDAPGARPPHADVRTVYPPVAQVVFRVGAAAGDRAALALRAIFAAADVGVVALVYALGGPGAGWAAALYAFHPLAATETAKQGHLDSLGVLLLLAALVYVSRERRGVAPLNGALRDVAPLNGALGGVAFALSVLTKYVPLAATLPLVRRGRASFAAAGAATILGVEAL